MIQFASSTVPDSSVQEVFPLIRFAYPTASHLSEKEVVPGKHFAGPWASHFSVREAVSCENKYGFEDATHAVALEELAEEIATLAAHIHAATHRLLTLIAEFDDRQGWKLGGHRSCAHWLSFRTGIDLGAAREKVRTARALQDLPQTSASMARGELSFSQVRALSRVATTENEEDLLALARGCTTAQLERMVRSVRRGSREDEAALEKIRHESRALSVFPDDDGMYVIRGRLPAEVGALLMRAVEAASDALYRKERAADYVCSAKEDAQTKIDSGAMAEAGSDSQETAGPAADPRAMAGPGSDSDRAAARRRADALGLLAERALAAGFDTPPISGSRAERYQVVLHVESKTLAATETMAAQGSPAGTESEPGRSDLEDGTRVSAETSRRLSCDAGLVRVSHAPGGGISQTQGDRVSHAPGGSILNVGRRTRTVPPSLRRALEARDRGCRFPGCGLRFCDAHHLTHWADGGDTSLSNTLLLCRVHHRLVHEGGWTVDWWGSGHPVFLDPRGGTHFEGRWKPPELGEHPVEALLEENHNRAISPDGWTASARWRREAEIPDGVYFRALEALHGAVP